jgi:transcriptional regulator with PAS, ATPase and Fis domain
MRRLVRLARLAARTDNTVLLLGESGTGKDLFARAIHAASPRRDGPLVVVNSASLSSGLEDSELFGHVRGAFTSASRDSTGLVCAAQGGTLFLDEIGDLSPSSQAKLLRCLESGEVRRVGDTRVQKVDIRFIAATNRDLLQAVHKGAFREDLYYRLAVITLSIPPLRQRPEDIPPLVHCFLTRLAAEEGREQIDISPQTLDLLVRHPWPGNARQLDACLRQAALLSGDSLIEADYLSEEIHYPLQALPPEADLSLVELEKNRILEVLQRCNGDRRQAENILGISRATLQRRLKEYGFSS